MINSYLSEKRRGIGLLRKIKARAKKSVCILRNSPLIADLHDFPFVKQRVTMKLKLSSSWNQL
jgi:hypothetical protein